MNLPLPDGFAFSLLRSTSRSKGMARTSLCTLGAASVLCLAALASTDANAQSTDTQKPIDEVVTIGTRVEGRSVTDTAVPIDIFTAKELQTVVSPDISDVVSKLVPSFDIDANAVNDGASHIRNFRLRGMVGDKSLLLVNGKRRHRSALLFMAAWGSNGPDLSPIPTIALRSLEVLRDGASALYGSDAIAGVLNFNLKDAPDGGSVQITGGQYAGHEHEGSYSVAVNKGLPLGDSGFVNISAEWAKRERADRGGLYDFPIDGSGLLPSQAKDVVMQNAVSVDGVALGTRYGPDALTERDFNGDGVIDSLVSGSDGIPDDPDTRFRDNLSQPEMAWGATPYETNKVFVNAGYKFNDNMELYGFGNYMLKHSDSSFFYRSPSAGQLQPLRRPDGTIYNPRDMYPGGFTPRFFAEVIDYSAVGGLKGAFGNGINYDFSTRYGLSSIDYTLKNSMNPSMGPNTPTSFHPGELVNTEYAFNGDFTRDIGVGWSENPLTLAFGFEYRNERYQIKPGNPDSYLAGPYAKPDPWNMEITQAEVDASPTDAFTQIECRIPGLEAAGSLCPTGDPVNNAVAVGSNGFPGYSPDFTSDYSRASEALYVSAESDLTDAFYLSLAGRYENYEDFGGNFSTRLSSRFAFSDTAAVRASIGTGFRAPTAGQISTINVSTGIDGNGNLVALGVFPASHPASKVFGATPLEPELAFSYSLGFVTEPADNVSLTIDYYSIAIRNRITFSSQFIPTAAQQAQLDALGIPGANTIQQVQFMTNDANTLTTGVDLVASYAKQWQSGSTTTVTFSGNWNHTEITKRPVRPDGSVFISEGRKFRLENDQAYRNVFSVRQSWDKFSLEGRMNSYGPSTYANNDFTNFQRFDPVHQVDLILDWNINPTYMLSFGGRNVFNTMPDVAKYGACCGQVYATTSADWFGSFYYLRLQATF